MNFQMKLLTVAVGCGFLGGKLPSCGLPGGRRSVACSHLCSGCQPCAVSTVRDLSATPVEQLDDADASCRARGFRHAGSQGISSKGGSHPHAQL